MSDNRTCPECGDRLDKAEYCFNCYGLFKKWNNPTEKEGITWILGVEGFDSPIRPVEVDSNDLRSEIEDINKTMEKLGFKVTFTIEKKVVK